MKAMIKLEARRTAMMIHQPHTGRKAATSPSDTARYEVCSRKKGVARK